MIRFDWIDRTRLTKDMKSIIVSLKQHTIFYILGEIFFYLAWYQIIDSNFNFIDRLPIPANGTWSALSDASESKCVSIAGSATWLCRICKPCVHHYQTQGC